MKKLIYLVLSVLFAISGIYGIYDTITTPKYDLATSIITILLLAFLAWFFWHLFLKPEPRHKHQAENAPESSPEATSDAPTVETAPILMPTRMMAWRTITWPSTSRPRDWTETLESSS